MSPLRFFREMALFLATAGGAVIGYAATAHMEPTVNLTGAFLGMSLIGMFADFCIRGGK
jgi:predicted exporter